MSPKMKDHHLLGAGAAACAVCCAPPLLALLGIASAGVAATAATIAFAGIAFGLVGLAATLLGLWARNRRAQTSTDACSDDGPVEVTISARLLDTR
jgi:uncharacterized protein (DUF58 family)